MQVLILEVLILEEGKALRIEDVPGGRREVAVRI
jgi:hypothetical protein